MWHLAPAPTLAVLGAKHRIVQEGWSMLPREEMFRDSGEICFPSFLLSEESSRFIQRLQSPQRIDATGKSPIFRLLLASSGVRQKTRSGNEGAVLQGHVPVACSTSKFSMNSEWCDQFLFTSCSLPADVVRLPRAGQCQVCGS